MNNLIRVACALAAAGMAASAAASPIDFHGYFRSGSGSSDQGGKELCFRLPGSVMSDLSLVRYLGYAELPEAAALRARLEAEQTEFLANGIHLIAVQGADGDLIVGDSHHSFWSPPPFSREAVDELMLAELRAVLRLPGARVVERWSGTYATLPDHLMIREAPLDGVRLVIVTSGTGASTAFAIAEETLAELFEEELQ